MANEVRKAAAGRLSAEYNKGYVGTGTQSAAVRGHVENVYGKVVQTSKNQKDANQNKPKKEDSNAAYAKQSADTMEERKRAERAYGRGKLQ